MESSVTSSFARTGQALADKAADKVRIAQDAAKDAGNSLSGKLEDVRSEADTIVNQGSKRAQSAGRQGLRAINDVVSQARDAALNASDSIVTYSKKNPAKSLAIAAASGLLVYAVIKALSPSRD